MVTSTLTVFSKSAHVLMDPCAIHSFVSIIFMIEVHKNLECLTEELLIITPVGDRFIANSVYQDCIVHIDGETLLVDI